jgi:hypothetical protein
MARAISRPATCGQAAQLSRHALWSFLRQTAPSGDQTALDIRSWRFFLLNLLLVIVGTSLLNG